MAEDLLKDKYGLPGIEAINSPVPEAESRRVALHLAAKDGNANDVNLLLEAKAAVDQQDECETTPLIVAALENKLETVKLLLDANANPIAGDNSGATALHYAARWAFPAVVKALLEAGAEPLLKDFCEKTALDSALDYRMQEKPEALETVAAIKAAEEVKKEAARKLLTESYGLPGLEAINEAIPGEGGQVTALHVAARDAKLDDVKVLVGAGVAVDKVEECEATALHFAAREGHLDVVRVLLRARASPVAKDNCGTTPLHYASRWAFSEVVKSLIAFKADVNIIDEMEQTALQSARDNRKQQAPEVLETIRILTEAGAQ